MRRGKQAIDQNNLKNFEILSNVISQIKEVDRNSTNYVMMQRKHAIDQNNLKNFEILSNIISQKSKKLTEIPRPM